MATSGAGRCPTAASPIANRSCCAAWCSSRTRSSSSARTARPPRSPSAASRPSGDSAETFAIDQAAGALEKPGRPGRGAAFSAEILRHQRRHVPGQRHFAAGASRGRNQRAQPAAVGARHARAVADADRHRAGGAEDDQALFHQGHPADPAAVLARRQAASCSAPMRGLGLLPAGYEDNLKAIIKAQDEGIAELAPAIASRFLTDEARRPVLFSNVRLYDADAQRFLAGQDVYVERGKILRVGPTKLARLPAGRAGHRRQGQDAGAGPVGQPHAHARRLQRAERSRDRRHLVPQSGRVDRARPVAAASAASRARCWRPRASPR